MTLLFQFGDFIDRLVSNQAIGVIGVVENLVAIIADARPDFLSFMFDEQSSSLLLQFRLLDHDLGWQGNSKSEVRPLRIILNWEQICLPDDRAIQSTFQSA